ncbi:MAG: FAD-binding oxidoreductase [Deltaproteobacteria bacterium]|nr:FAD-binding oxidoreductase [Deltaproteobacteria bacterium]TLN02982.1 MAG: FAD-binding oxidoreductase [bacterium]
MGKPTWKDAVIIGKWGIWKPVWGGQLVMAGADSHLADKLRTVVRGQVLTDQESLRYYSFDQSIYQIEPRVVVLPEDVEDARRLVSFAVREGLPITARGGGSGTAGSALGSGIVMALPEHGCWNRISDFASSADMAQVRAGAGAYHNQLQDYLRQRGFFLPADVTSAEISRIGGNIATKASGPHALRYGSIDRFLEQVTFITDRGEVVDTGDEASIPERFRTRLVELRQRLHADRAAMAVLEARRQLKTASGYNLFAFLDHLSSGKLITRLLAGSVGTLGLVTEATVRAEPSERQQVVVLLYFADLVETARAVCALRELPVAAIELISRETLNIIRRSGRLPDSLAVDANLVLVELSGPAAVAELEKVENVLHAEGFRLLAGPVVAGTAEEIERLWAVRKQVLWLIRNPQPGFQALSVVNDVGVPPEHLAEFISEVEQVFARQRLTSLIYGHAGSGNLHLRPLFDLTQPGLPARIQLLADEIYQVVLRYGGTISGEHGMGRLRAPYLSREWGADLYGYMREVKEIFDPGELFNPGVVFSNSPITDHLREELLSVETSG